MIMTNTHQTLPLQSACRICHIANALKKIISSFFFVVYCLSHAYSHALLLLIHRQIIYTCIKVGSLNSLAASLYNIVIKWIDIWQTPALILVECQEETRRFLFDYYCIQRFDSFQYLRLLLLLLSLLLFYLLLLIRFKVWFEALLLLLLLL